MIRSLTILAILVSSCGPTPGLSTSNSASTDRCFGLSGVWNKQGTTNSFQIIFSNTIYQYCVVGWGDCGGSFYLKDLTSNGAATVIGNEWSTGSQNYCPKVSTPSCTITRSGNQIAIDCGSGVQVYEKE